MFNPIVGPSSEGSQATRWIPSSKRNPCPVCGRTKDGDCRISSDGRRVLCHHPKPDKPGQTKIGKDGQTWAFLGNTEDGDGRAGQYKIHEERRLTVVASGGTAISNGTSKPIDHAGVSSVALLASEHQGPLTLACFSPSMEEKASRREEEFFYFDAVNRTQRKEEAGKKKAIYAHTWKASEQKWATTFNKDCPSWNESLISEAEGLPIYFEGEKCADIATKDFGLIGLSLPGQSATNIEECEKTLNRHKEAGLGAVVYVADNDKEGKKKKALMQQAAFNSGLPFIGLDAEAIWEDMPEGGSIDDVCPIANSPDDVKRQLEEAIQDVVTASSGEQATAPEGSNSKDSQSDFELRWAALEAIADDFASSTGSILKKRTGIANAATELGINRLTQSDLDRLIQAAQRRLRPASKPLEGGSIFKAKREPFVLDGLIRHGLNMLVSAPGVGKSRFCAAFASAWLAGKEKWLDKELRGPSIDDRHVLIIGTDQSREDWAITLLPVGLCTSVDPFGDDAEEELILNAKVTLHTLETGTQLDDDGLAIIRRWCDEFPDCLVIVDSFAAVLPAGVDEEKPSAAQPLYALQEALGSCFAIVCHHARKAAGKEGSLGVGTGRGSSAIEGAVSRLLTLSPIHRMEHGQRVACESDPRRELLSTKRGAATQHLIVNSDGWTLEGTAEALKAEERRDRAIQGLDDQKAEILTVLEDTDGWLTTKEVVEALGVEWEKDRAEGGKERRLTLKRLDRLVALGLVEKASSGTDKSWKRK